ncbi:glycoside hydrolase superfamily [Gongronella butleri]|nr:glycoside hydrolase superfamily [Gongronella butleri]
MPSVYDLLRDHTSAHLSLRYSMQNQTFLVDEPLNSKPIQAAHLSFARSVMAAGPNAFKIKYILKTDKRIRLHQLDVAFQLPIQDHAMMAEGFQCWSHTHEADARTTLAPISRPVAWITKFDLQGDYNFFKYPDREGVIQAVGYTYLRDTRVSDAFVFLGSLAEHNGYTYWVVDYPANKLTLQKDILGKTVADELVMEWLVVRGPTEREIWQRYASFYLAPSALTIKDYAKQVPDMTGWTSWYQWYEAVTEKDVLACLDGFVAHGYPIDLFQIDDGFEKAIGDWLLVDEVKFPRGMGYVAGRIKEAGMTPGLWLAPFAVGLDSALNKEHPDWLLLENGEPVLAGPNWGGFRSLDIYHPEVQAYLQQVFDTVIDDWGYSFLKLDFLFCAAMVPRNGKSRGEILWDAVSLVHDWTRGRARVLASGVTLPSVWGRLDYARVSSDAAPWWDHTVLRLANVRERVATYNALVSTLNRWPMNNAVIASDPDVFFIRSVSCKLTPAERHTLVTVNHLLGKLTLMSDNVALYTPQEHALYASTFPKPVVNVQSMRRIAPHVYQLIYTSRHRHYVTYTNVSPLPYRFHLPLDLGNAQETTAVYFELANVLDNANATSLYAWHHAHARIPLHLRPHTTRTFLLLDDKNDIFAGSTAHLLPGNEIAALDIDRKMATVHIKLATPMARHSKDRTLFLRADALPKDPTILVQDQEAQMDALPADRAGFAVLKVTFNTP